MVKFKTCSTEDPIIFCFKERNHKDLEGTVAGFHLSCYGLESVPVEDDWVCKYCQRKGLSIETSRSKKRKPNGRLLRTLDGNFISPCWRLDHLLIMTSYFT